MHTLLTLALAGLALLTLAPAAWPHPGGLDAHGCHHDRQRGGYHCHQGELAGQSFASKDEMLRQARAGARPPAAPPGQVTQVPTPPRSAEIRVVRIVDGDTIVVCCIAGREERVRYIGMDTPETKHPTRGEEPGGREATEINRKLVEGKTARLELDVQERDRYGRVLAYVWVERDGEQVMVNA
ncbi:MAG: thermonuclease family protein, partial [Candidatus Rokubacteria bacterium]|nr:thermonuclease family protein [Candidatus Rokubacteria bacterium]